MLPRVSPAGGSRFSGEVHSRVAEVLKGSETIG